MKRWLPLFALGVVALGWNSQVFAFGGEGAFYDFLRGHPEIRHDLEHNPSLVNNPEYIEAHPQFREFYRNHDEVRGELRDHASDIMRREEVDMAHPEQHEKSEQEWRAGQNQEREDGNLDTFLDSHPEVRNKLDSHPELANNPEFLRAHPGFAHFVETHPGVEQQLRSHPRKFMSNEESYDHNH